MIRVIICGILGNMGSKLLERCFESEDICVVAGIDRERGMLAGVPIYAGLDECTEKADILVDFSHPDAAGAIVPYCRSSGTALVMCTTGHSEQQDARIRRLGEDVPVFYSANMSMGIALLAALTRRVAALLQEDFDIEIVERHHNRKIDAPSGTALLLADSINEACAARYDYVSGRRTQQRRKHDEIGIHSIRGGTIVGDHEVIFAGDDEVITLSHSASSRNLFAAGALRAIRFLSRQRPGLYSMESIVQNA